MHSAAIVLTVRMASEARRRFDDMCRLRRIPSHQERIRPFWNFESFTSRRGAVEDRALILSTRIDALRVRVHHCTTNTKAQPNMHRPRGQLVMRGRKKEELSFGRQQLFESCLRCIVATCLFTLANDVKGRLPVFVLYRHVGAHVNQNLRPIDYRVCLLARRVSL